jgi:biopolymer transport protein ExbB/TolQ
MQGGIVSVTEQFLKFALLGAEWVMYVLIVLSIISLSIIIERCIFFSKMKGDSGAFFVNLTQKLINKSTPQEIAKWCESSPLAEAKVAAVGLEKAHENASLRSIEESMNAQIISQRIQFDRGLTILGTLGNNTPFVGLFGTIIGIIEAFHALATTKTAGPEVVMASISEALVATAVSLLVAIPAVVAYNFIGRAVRKRQTNSEATARLIVTHFGTES